MTFKQKILGCEEHKIKLIILKRNFQKIENRIK